MSACCNCVNKGNLQFSGHTVTYKQSVDDLTLAQFLKYVESPKKRQVSIASFRKLLTGGFRRKRNRSNTSTGARPDSKGRTIRKVMGGGEFSSSRNFFSLSNSLYEFFFSPKHENFLGIIGVHEFFSFHFPLHEYFFCTSPAPLPPSPPNKFSNGPSLRCDLS